MSETPVAARRQVEPDQTLRTVEGALFPRKPGLVPLSHTTRDDRCDRPDACIGGTTRGSVSGSDPRMLRFRSEGVGRCQRGSGGCLERERRWQTGDYDLTEKIAGTKVRAMVR